MSNNFSLLLCNLIKFTRARFLQSFPSHCKCIRNQNALREHYTKLSLQLHRRASQSNNYGNANCDTKLLLASSAFIAFFKKEEDEQMKETSIWQKILPKDLAILFEEREPEDETPEGRLIMTIKRTILLIDEQKLDKAEQMIHLALRMAQAIQHQDGITLCFDIMANLAFERQQFEKAEKLFVLVMQRMLQKGIPQNDNQLLHISLKIAQIADNQGLAEKADLGYTWTLGELKRKLKDKTEDPDGYEIWGLANDCYGKFLLERGKFAEARNCLHEAYVVYTQVHGNHDANVVDLLNNLAVVCTHLDDFTSAEKYINEAIMRSRNHPELYESGVYEANRGLVYLKKGLISQAQKSCENALRQAKRSQNPDGIEQSTFCLDEIKAATG